MCVQILPEEVLPAIDMAGGVALAPVVPSTVASGGRKRWSVFGRKGKPISSDVDHAKKVTSSGQDPPFPFNLQPRPSGMDRGAGMLK
jgi:hypothetical protein